MANKMEIRIDSPHKWTIILLFPAILVNIFLIITSPDESILVADIVYIDMIIIRLAPIVGVGVVLIDKIVKKVRITP